MSKKTTATAAHAAASPTPVPPQDALMNPAHSLEALLLGSGPRARLSSPTFEDFAAFVKAVNRERAAKMPEIPILRRIDESVLNRFESSTGEELSGTNEEILTKLGTLFTPQTSAEKSELLSRHQFRLDPQQKLSLQVPAHHARYLSILIALRIPESARGKALVDSYRNAPRLFANLERDLALTPQPSVADVLAASKGTASFLDRFDLEYLERYGRPPLTPSASTSLSAAPPSTSTLPAVASVPPSPARPRSPRPTVLDSAEKDRCLSEQLCFRCRQPGHLARDCTAFEGAPDTPRRMSRVSHPPDTFKPGTDHRRVAGATSVGGFAYDPRPQVLVKDTTLNREVPLLVDTGATESTASLVTLGLLGYKVTTDTTLPPVYLADGRPVQPLGYVDTKVVLPSARDPTDLRVYALPSPNLAPGDARLPVPPPAILFSTLSAPDYYVDPDPRSATRLVRKTARSRRE